MATTRSGLQAAQIKNTNNGQSVYFMFNPSDYTITKTNTYDKNKPETGQDQPDIKFKTGAARTINSLKLIFDTYQDGADADDVREYIKPLSDMMKIDHSASPAAPPIVQFIWGGLTFKAVIESLTQVFKLFKADGTPVRAEVTVNLTEVPDSAGSTETAGEFSGADTVLAAIFKGLPPGTPIPQISTTINMIAGTSLSLAASTASGGTVGYRSVAELNNIDNPLNIPNGTPINIPSNNISSSPPPGPTTSSGGPSSAPSGTPAPPNRPNY